MDTPKDRQQSYFAALLAREPNWHYGDILPMAHNAATGESKFALPGFLQKPLLSGVELMDSAKSGAFYGNENLYIPQVMDVAGAVSLAPIGGIPGGAIGAGIGSRLTRADPGIGEPVSSQIARGEIPISGGKLKHYIDALKKAGVENVEEISPIVKKDAQDIAKIRSERSLAKRNLDENYNPLLFEEGNRAYGPQSAKMVVAFARENAEKAAAKKAERDILAASIESILKASGNDQINKSFLNRMTEKAKYIDIDGGKDFYSEASKGAIDAVKRILKKDGWTVRHTSQEAGRNTSTYLIAPTKDFEVRVSDHYLPERPGMFARGGRWDDELVIDRTNLKDGVSGFIEQIMAKYYER